MLKLMMPIVGIILLWGPWSPAAFSMEKIDHGMLDPMMRSLNHTTWGYQIIKGDKNSPARYIERFEVRSGDCFANRSWNDCHEDRERSELSEKNKTTQSGDQRWYHWQFYLPESFMDIYPTKVTLGQFHQLHSHPAWMFELNHHGYWLEEHLHSRHKLTKKLISSEQLKGHWQDILVWVIWQRNHQGRLKVWVNHHLLVNYYGPTMSAHKVYFKYGLYRAFISRYQQKYHQRLPTQWLYYANVWEKIA